MNKALLVYKIFKNQGARYVLYRSAYELARKTGALKFKFPIDPPFRTFISLDEWRKNKPAFLFEDKGSIQLPKVRNTILEEKYSNFMEGRILYFNAYYCDVGKPIDWMKNPDTGYVYDNQVHWTRIDDFTPEAGDIKFVWEKSRFSFLLDLIRYDYHYETDCGELVFSTIDSWMNDNPVNQGPNYKCSQESSLRVLHWTFALYYYAQHAALTEARFSRIMHFIYWHLHHVRNNIQFSRICVRNNHAVTEVMMLYLCGLIFPFMEETKEWSVAGKKWLEEEIAYQVYPDGTYIQYSHNYQRVLMQLMTLSQLMANMHGDTLSENFLSRSRAVVDYIRQMTDPVTGQLPNYGANDGALFFRLNDDDYRDYRSQLNAIYYANYGTSLFQDHTEDIRWLAGNRKIESKYVDNFSMSSVSIFPDGGIYSLREGDTFTFIKCAAYKDRPSHADNLHVDIWYKGINLMRDAGTYKYYSHENLVRYFTGTRAHCTVTIDDHDQMQKGDRFIWYDWTKEASASWETDETSNIFYGKIKAFGHIEMDLTHQRIIHKFKGTPQWIIKDELSKNDGHVMKQWWHPSPQFFSEFSITAFDEAGVEIPVKKMQGYYSSFYGVKEEVMDICFETSGRMITTFIKKSGEQ